MRVIRNDIKHCPRLKEKLIIVSDWAPGREFLLLRFRLAEGLVLDPTPDMSGLLSERVYSCQALESVASSVALRMSGPCRGPAVESQVALWMWEGEAWTRLDCLSLC